LNDLARSVAAPEVDRPLVWQDDTLPGAVWMLGRSSGYQIDPVDEYVIGAVTGAAGYRLHRGAQALPVRPGELVVLDPERAHRGTQDADGPWDARLLVLPTALLWSALDELPPLLRTSVDEPVISRPGLQRRFVVLHRASQAGASRLERECTLLALLEDLTPVARGRRRPSGDPAVAAAVAVLRDRFVDRVDLHTLARATGVSKFRLLRRFRAELGVTPHPFLASVRIAHARRLLAMGVAVSEVAAAAGFADQSHLTRQFGARLGFTPARYRRAVAAGRG
jgi:AraC-like DNA-binding protein